MAFADICRNWFDDCVAQNFWKGHNFSIALLVEEIKALDMEKYEFEQTDVLVLMALLFFSDYHNSDRKKNHSIQTRVVH